MSKNGRVVPENRAFQAAAPLSSRRPGAGMHCTTFVKMFPPEARARRVLGGQLRQQSSMDLGTKSNAFGRRRAMLTCVVSRGYRKQLCSGQRQQNR
jgi:hypothetical protein